MADVKVGDTVKWKSHGGEARGEVEKKLTGDATVAGHKAKASRDDPQFVVRSEKSGGQAAHKPSALKKA